MLKNKVVPVSTFKLGCGAGENHRKGCENRVWRSQEDAAGPGAAQGALFPVYQSDVRTQQHSLRETQPGTAASVSYLDRWADCPTFRHRDTAKPSCTGRGNGS